MPRKLTVVAPGAPNPEGESEPRKDVTTIRLAADASERDLLVALRSHLAKEMDSGKVPAHALASVSAKIREYDRDIRAIDARSEQEGAGSGPTEDEAWTAV